MSSYRQSVFSYDSHHAEIVGEIYGQMGSYWKSRIGASYDVPLNKPCTITPTFGSVTFDTQTGAQQISLGSFLPADIYPADSIYCWAHKIYSCELVTNIPVRGLNRSGHSLNESQTLSIPLTTLHDPCFLDENGLYNNVVHEMATGTETPAKTMNSLRWVISPSYQPTSYYCASMPDEIHAFVRVSYRDNYNSSTQSGSLANWNRTDDITAFRNEVAKRYIDTFAPESIHFQLLLNFDEDKRMEDNKRFRSE